MAHTYSPWQAGTRDDIETYGMARGESGPLAGEAETDTCTSDSKKIRVGMPVVAPLVHHDTVRDAAINKAIKAGRIAETPGYLRGETRRVDCYRDGAN